MKTYRIDKENPVVIVSSTQDLASQNIAENLVAKHGFSQSTPGGGFAHRDHSIRLVTVEKPCIYIEPTDLPAMTVHATGNLTKNAEFGGRPEELSFVDPARIQRALRRLRDGVVEVGLEIDVTMEATHHGPTSFPIPVCFVEIGSGPREWVNPALGGLAADAIMEAGTGVRVRSLRLVLEEHIIRPSSTESVLKGRIKSGTSYRGTRLNREYQTQSSRIRSGRRVVIALWPWWTGRV